MRQLWRECPARLALHILTKTHMLLRKKTSRILSKDIVYLCADHVTFLKWGNRYCSYILTQTGISKFTFYTFKKDKYLCKNNSLSLHKKKQLCIQNPLTLYKQFNSARHLIQYRGQYFGVTISENGLILAEGRIINR